MASTKEGSWFDLYTADIETQLRVSFDGRATRSGLAWRLIADLVLCNLLFGQCVVAYWRGTWELALHYSALQYGVSRVRIQIYYCLNFQLSRRKIVQPRI